MKAFHFISIIFLAAIFFQSCGGEEGPSAEEVFLEKITGSWQISSASFDGKDVTESFPGMVVTINASKSFSVTNAVPPMWKSSNTFSLTEAGTSFQINRDDGLIINVTQVTDSKLILKFSYDAAAMGGRTGSVTGQFTFEFNAN